jgi:hypothetical protein
MNTGKIKLLINAMLFITITCVANIKDHRPMKDVVDEGMQLAMHQSLLMAESLKDDSTLLPRTTDYNSKLITSNPAWWCSGFFPGELWYLYEYSKDSTLLEWAEKYTTRLEKEKFTTNNHDIGFMIYCSFGNGYRLTSNEQYKQVIETASLSLSTRYNDNVGAIQSWDTSANWQYPVIIDNMMNLEMLLWTAKNSNQPRYSDIALNHSIKTMKNHFRNDFSCYHVVSYDTITGKPQVKATSQGYANESAWSRGQAWALYGYSMMYRETGRKEFLKQAENIAQFILNHPNLPCDKIPYWDFNAPNIPDAYRDASAAAVISSALIELSQVVDNKRSEQYLSVAEIQLRALTSPEYLAVAGSNGGFVLKHSVGSLPTNSEVDVPLSYADYYYVEALMRYKKLKNL